MNQFMVEKLKYETKRGTKLFNEKIVGLQEAGFNTTSLSSQALENPVLLRNMVKNIAIEESPMLLFLEAVNGSGIDTTELMNRIKGSLTSIEHANEVFFNVLGLSDDIEEETKEGFEFVLEIPCDCMECECMECENMG